MTISLPFHDDRIFSGTNYLGARYSSDFSKKLNEGIEKYGVHYGGSRWSNTCPGIYDDAENFLKDWFGVEGVSLLSSGSMAGTFLKELCEPFDKVLYHKDSLHPSAILPFQKSYPFNDIVEINELDIKREEKIAIFVNSIDPTTLYQFDIASLKMLKSTLNFTIIVDDSHGIGILGEEGKGFLSQFQKSFPNKDFIILASLGKSYSIPAGIVFAKNDLKLNLGTSPRWGGASPPSPAYIYAFIHLHAFYQEQLRILRDKIELFLSKLLLPDHFEIRENFPVIKVLSGSYYEYLKDHNYEISSFAYPDLNGKVTERIVINSAKREEDLLALVGLLNKKTL